MAHRIDGPDGELIERAIQAATAVLKPYWNDNAYMAAHLAIEAAVPILKAAWTGAK